MGRRGPSRQSAVDVATGEVVQLELFGKKPVNYDWQPHPGRHANVCKALMKKVWRADSGYNRAERDVFAFWMWNSPEGFEPLRMPFNEVAGLLGVSQTVVSRSVGRLNLGGLLLEAEQVGRVKFYAVNPRAAYDGPASAQREATKHARHPVVPAPAPAKEAAS